MTAHFAPTRICTKARVLEAVRYYFRVSGMSPSYSEIGLRAGIPKQRVSRYLDELQREEYLTYLKGESRSILLIDPGANLSDADLRAACVGRGWAVIETCAPPLAIGLPQIRSCDDLVTMQPRSRDSHG